MSDAGYKAGEAFVDAMILTLEATLKTSPPEYFQSYIQAISDRTNACIYLDEDGKLVVENPDL